MPLSRSLTIAASVGAAVALAVPVALGQSLSDKKEQVDSSISGLREDIEAAKRKEGVLSTEIEAQTERIRALEDEIGTLSEKVAALERELAKHEARLDRLRERYRYQTERLRLLRSQHEEAETRLEARLVELYVTEQPDDVAILLQAGSLNDLIEQVELFNEIGRQDRRIAEELGVVKHEMRLSRRQTARTKAEAAEVTAVVAARTSEQRAARDAVVTREEALEEARAGKRGLLSGVREERHEAEEDLEAMLAASAEIAGQIEAARASATSQSVVGTTSVSASGFVWPVQGVLTSGFGWRWGRMHEGIDIAAPAGTPIAAAAAGTIIYAGWLGGYGNVTIIDHGGGVATAYGHQSAIYVLGGPVAQGQVIGAVGTTGHSTGNHVHFEVRINGAPVDPFGYL